MFRLEMGGYGACGENAEPGVVAASRFSHMSADLFPSPAQFFKSQWNGICNHMSRLRDQPL